MLVVDEVGYLTYGTDAANMLFHVVNERHRRHRSMIFTTNKALKARGRVLHDEDLGQAIIDRVLERGRLIRLDGPSIRTLHLKFDDALKDESDQDDEVARISGTHISYRIDTAVSTPGEIEEGFGLSIPDARRPLTVCVIVPTLATGQLALTRAERRVMS